MIFEYTLNVLTIITRNLIKLFLVFNVFKEVLKLIILLTNREDLRLLTFI